MCLWVGLFGVILIGTLCASWTCVIFFSHQVKVVFCHYFFQTGFLSLAPFLLPLVISIAQMFLCFWSSLKLSLFLLSLFSFCYYDRFFFSTLSSSLLIQSTSPSSQFLILSSVFLFSDIVFFISSWFLFIVSMSFFVLM